MKVLLLNGSTRKNGCTYLALSEVAKALETDGVETEIVQMGGGAVRDCIGCNGCAGKGQCVFGDDMVNEIITKAKAADGFVLGSPVYYAHPSADRFYPCWIGSFMPVWKPFFTSPPPLW